jgi:hypothetical protein
MSDMKMGGICEHCGGAIGPDGYAMGGEVEDPSEENEMGVDPLIADREREQRLPEELPETDQMARTRQMRRAAFATAIARRRG